MDVPVQYFQSVIAIQLAIAGALLFQIHFFDADGAHDRALPDPRLRLLVAILLTVTILGSLTAIRTDGGRWAAAWLTAGLAVSLLPILVRVLPPLRRDAKTRQPYPRSWTTVVGLILYVAVAAIFVLIS